MPKDLLLHRGQWQSVCPWTPCQGRSDSPGWGFGWGTFTAHGPGQLPRREHHPRVDWPSPPLSSLDCRSLTTAMWQWPPGLSHTHRRILTKNHCQAHSHNSGWTLAQKDAQPTRSSWQLDPGADKPGRKAPMLVEGAQSSLKGLLSGRPPNIQALQFTQWQATAFRLSLAQAEASGWWEASCSLSALHHWDFLPQVYSPGPRDFHVIRQGGNPSLDLNPSTLHGEVGDAPQSPVQGCKDHQRCMAP